jgi:penicillin-binding protein 1A
MISRQMPAKSRPLNTRRRFVAVAAVAAALFTPVVASSQQQSSPPAPAIEAWQLITPPQSSQVYARDGSLIGEIGREWRTIVSLKTLPAYLPNAFIAVEDQRFYSHNGVDIVGIAGAIKDNILGASRGASTITQQLVGNMHPDLVNRRDPSPMRKLREQKAAIEMTRRYSKAQVLEAYLNQINFGHGWYGVETAARHYFGKGAAQVSLAEAATLAALPKTPVGYDPIKYPEKAKNRRNAILALMVDQKMITQRDADVARKEPVKTVPNGGMSAQAPYFVDAVRTQAERAGIQVSQGGFKIHTGLDPALQRAAVSSLADETSAIEQRPGWRHATLANHPRGSTDFLEGAVVAIDAKSGDVLALVGGRDHAEAPFNRATNGLRQPGSSFKPFVYARAISDSIAPNSIVPDTSLEIAYDRQTYRPKNSDGEFLGNITLREAIAKSRNPVAVQLWQRLGADSVIALARRAGISTPIASYPSSAIGASVVRPIDFVAAYTMFANLGTPVEPRLITRIEGPDRRVVMETGVDSLAPAMSPEAAYIVRDMMRDVVERGTATSVRRIIPGDVPVAGKTGTTDDNTDVWFVGVTPDIVAGVWLGFDRPQPIAERGVAGGSLAAPVFARMLERAGYARPSDAWKEPPVGVAMETLDRLTGKLAVPETPADRRYVEYFILGTEPGALHIRARRIFGLGPIVF